MVDYRMRLARVPVPWRQGLSSVKTDHADVILKDLARSATFAVRVRIRCALDPSQAQDDPIMRWGN